MTDSYSDSRQQGGQSDNGRDGGRGGRGGRGQGNREGGGFRIRLSDNEMRSARALQEALNLRSTVAVLGFAVRTLGQMLEEGKLEELVAAQRAQGNQGNRGGGRRDDDRGGRRDNRGDSGRGSRPDPFARPAKPQPTAPDSSATTRTRAFPEPSTAVSKDRTTVLRLRTTRFAESLSIPSRSNAPAPCTTSKAISSASLHPKGLFAARLTTLSASEPWQEPAHWQSIVKSILVEPRFLMDRQGDLHVTWG